MFVYTEILLESCLDAELENYKMESRLIRLLINLKIGKPFLSEIVSRVRQFLVTVLLV